MDIKDMLELSDEKILAEIKRMRDERNKDTKVEAAKAKLKAAIAEINDIYSYSMTEKDIEDSAKATIISIKSLYGNNYDWVKELFSSAAEKGATSNTKSKTSPVSESSKSSTSDKDLQDIIRKLGW